MWLELPISGYVQCMKVFHPNVPKSDRKNIAQPADVHYNHCVSPSARGHLVKMLIIPEPRSIFDQIWHTLKLVCMSTLFKPLAYETVIS